MCACSLNTFIWKQQTYRKPGWLWTDLHYFHKYLHNDELNSRFHMGISKYHVRATHILYTHNSSWSLYSQIFTVKPCPKSPWSSGWLWTPKHMVFQSSTTLRIQNEIVCDIFGTRYKLLTQTVPFIIKPVDVRFNCSFSTKSGKFDHLEIDWFRKIHEKHIRQHIIQANYTYL